VHTLIVPARSYAAGIDAPARGVKKGLSWHLNLLLVYLAGITIFGKGPTYIGIDPFFWGEAVLGVMLLWTVRRWDRVTLRTSQAHILTFLVSVFLAVGAVETAIDYPDGGLNTLRDSADYYYALFYFVGLAIASNTEQSRVFSSRWKLFWLLAVPWGIVETASGNWLSQHSPILPGSRGNLLLSSSGSEVAQNVGLGCLLLVSGVWHRGLLARAGTRISLALAGLAAVALYPGRGSKVAVMVAFSLFFALSLSQSSSGRTLRRRLGTIAVLSAFLIAGALASGVTILDRLGLDRFAEVAPGQVEGTAEWRVAWWQGIEDAVMERNPAFGLGFGDRLSEYNPFITDTESAASPRSPHNFNMTVFARMGIVGALLWAGILLTGLFVPLWKGLTASSATARAETGYRAFWITAIFAAWVDSSFGVLMEGPVMAIPFWLMLGMLSMRPGPNAQIFARVPTERRQIIGNPVLGAD
jgi:hypothetical protein